MGLYVDLSQEDKNIIEAWERNQRGWFNTLASVLMQARALQAAIDASGGVREIVTALDNGQDIPNTSGIAGAQNMTKAEWSSLIVAGLDDFIATYDTAAFRQLMAKAAGPTAGL